ncbi:unnamed protein product [Arabidopsis lyrata]|uniref:Predicted protein n=1 Tax=Arabidopsis lyrata subsp. lyrata TaxID=81972 RepID=D7KPQ2_ARALL|nr:predicted protein [Arabidopsis lyrata subsp. lyrata]CAH8254691.1 unnamed protein product [Arabidopsis lyrata]
MSQKTPYRSLMSRFLIVLSCHDSLSFSQLETTNLRLVSLIKKKINRVDKTRFVISLVAAYSVCRNECLDYG